MNIFKKVVVAGLTVTGISMLLPQSVQAHCQLPCGIYADSARVSSMLEDAGTIAKATVKISELAGKTDAQSQNQLVRWVNNKEKHAENIISTISDYFLTQRVKPNQEDYVARLTKHHRVIVAAMKAKQNSNLQYAEALKASIEALSGYYPGHKH